MASTLEDYFADLVDKLYSVSARAELIGQPTVETDDHETGILRARIRYEDGSTIQIDMAITLVDGYPEVKRYSFQFMDPQAHCIFRYDNAPHYPALPLHPEHVHRGVYEQESPHRLPSIGQLSREIDDYLRTRPLTLP